MSFVAVAIGGSALIGGVTSVISGNKAAGAARDAAAAQAETDKYIYDTTRADYAPYRSVGVGALGKLAQIYGVQPASLGDSGNSPWKASFAPAGDWNSYLDANPDVKAGWDNLSAADKQQFPNPTDFAKWHYTTYGQNENRQGVPGSTGSGGGDNSYGGFVMSPGYQFRLNQGLQAIERSASARGNRLGGATMKALNDYAQGSASDEFQRYVGGLQSLAGVGQSATGSIAQAGQQYASNSAQTNATLGNARASAYANTGNAINQTVGNLASAYLYNKGYGTPSYGRMS